MSLLADLPELVGLFSYSREDDEAFEGTLSALRDAIQRELTAQLGRSKTNFRLWQHQKSTLPASCGKLRAGGILYSDRHTMHRASTALKLLREGQPVGLVFSDVMMPEGWTVSN